MLGGVSISHLISSYLIWVAVAHLDDLLANVVEAQLLLRYLRLPTALQKKTGLDEKARSFLDANRIGQVHEERAVGQAVLVAQPRVHDEPRFCLGPAHSDNTMNDMANE